MRVLIINRLERARSLDTLYEGVAEHLDDVTVVKLSKLQIENLPGTLETMDLSGYDRVLVDIPVRRAAHALKQFNRIPGLIYYEEDAYQEFMGASKFHGEFLNFFRALGGAPVIVTGYNIANYLKANGITAHCIPKAYDDRHLSNLNSPRDIPLAFVGRINNKVYSERKTLLDAMASAVDLQTLRTETAEEYLALLNRIRCFFSADIGFDEYMAKNFEAMACGCLLIAKRQPSEDERLGFIDMVNVVHYDTADEAIEKYRLLQADPLRLEAIARAGEELALGRHRLSMRSADFAGVICDDYPQRRPTEVKRAGWLAPLRALLRR